MSEMSYARHLLKGDKMERSHLKRASNEQCFGMNYAQCADISMHSILHHHMCLLMSPCLKCVSSISFVTHDQRVLRLCLYDCVCVEALLFLSANGAREGTLVQASRLQRSR